MNKLLYILLFYVMLCVLAELTGIAKAAEVPVDQCINIDQARGAVKAAYEYGQQEGAEFVMKEVQSHLLKTCDGEGGIITLADGTRIACAVIDRTL